MLKAAPLCYNPENVKMDIADMSEEQLKALWEKTDSHAQAIGSISERTLLLEHRAQTHEDNMQKMMARGEESDKAIRRDIQTMNGTMLNVLQSISESKGAKNAVLNVIKMSLPWAVALIGGVLWLIQSMVK